MSPTLIEGEYFLDLNPITLTLCQCTDLLLFRSLESLNLQLHNVLRSASNFRRIPQHAHFTLKRNK
jgi:hypothetical protein